MPGSLCVCVCVCVCVRFFVITITSFLGVLVEWGRGGVLETRYSGDMAAGVGGDSLWGNLW